MVTMIPKWIGSTYYLHEREKNRNRDNEAGPRSIQYDEKKNVVRKNDVFVG
jgi:hypothetical protein